MSIITTYPLNGIDYDARDAAGYNATRTSGVYSAEEDFAVTPAGGVKVTVSAGQGWVRPARFEGYSIIMREAETLTLAMADGQRPRIDRIVLRFDAASRKSSLLILQGTPDTQPTAPAISRTATVYDLCLAEVMRPASSTAITVAHIKDTRTNEALCGIMRDAVTRIPTEQLDAEARARIDEMQRRADKIIRNYSGGYIGRYELTLQPTGWKTASGSTGYGYQYDATLADATTDHVPFASIALGSQAVAIEAQVATVCDAYDGYIRFAAKRVPTTAIVLDVTLLGPGGPLDVATALLGEAVCGNAICGM